MIGRPDVVFLRIALLTRRHEMELIQVYEKPLVVFYDIHE